MAVSQSMSCYPRKYVCRMIWNWSTIISTKKLDRRFADYPAYRRTHRKNAGGHAVARPGYPDRPRTTFSRQGHPQKVAINAVMAGAKSDYLPVIIAALEATLEERYGLHHRQTTTHAAAPLLIISGPIVKDLNINYGNGCFGPG